MNCITQSYWILRVLFSFLLLYLGNVVFTFLIADETPRLTEIHWENNLDFAKNRALREGKPLLIHFYGDYCTPCKAMERDVYSQQEIVQKINNEFVAIKINTTQNQQLLSLSGVRYIPTDIYLSPSGEQIDAKVVAGVTAIQYFAELTRITASLPKTVYAPQQTVGAIPAQMSTFVQNANSVQCEISQSQGIEGFAVSGTKTPQTTNHSLADYFVLNHPTASLALTNQVPVNSSERSNDYVVPIQYTYLPSQTTQTPQPQPATTMTQQSEQQNRNKDNIVANNTLLTNNAPVVNNNNNILSNSNNTNVAEVFESGQPRKQPVTELGAGISLGVVSSQNNNATEQRKILALDGYCPIALAEKTEWIKGNPEITVEYENVLFRFASAESQIKFTSRPEMYAPIIKGHDVVEWITNHREVSGIRKFGAWYRGRIFLFVNSENYEKFKMNPEFYAQSLLQTSTVIASTEDFKMKN
ncbi:MAG: thioredoxin family protein [Planctomycetaceae bacterium]|jgi:thiol-disulfide isomerase/thioredoxin/YHS domain-containing protein|nr:thioredoxin family protein [Planctomycetaceae bacterium]